MPSFSNDLFLYFFISIAIGALYSLIAYSKKNNPWSKTTNLLLAGVRFISVSALTFLLFSPKYSATTVHEESPTYVFLEDNSNSISLALDSSDISLAKKNLNILKKSLKGTVITEKLVETNNNTSSFSPISQSLTRVKEKYQNQNLSSITLVSDGINNIGGSIDQQYLNTTVHTIGLGKQITQKDAFVSKVNYNKSVFLGNDFLITSSITANGYEGQQVILELRHNNKVIDTKTEKVSNNNITYSKLLHASEKGKQNYSISITPLKEEITLINNKKIFTVNVISDQKRVLIYAASPHPSIKMLRNIIDKDERYTSTIKYSDENLLQKDLNANLYIFCGTPTIPNTLAKTSKKTGVIHFPLSTTKKLDLGWLTYLPQNTKPDDVRPIFNANFSSFLVEDNDFSLFSNTQPLSVPFGDVSLNKGTPLLFQKLGTLTTQKPLICVQDKTLPHQAIILGEGWWRMKLHENNNGVKILEDLFFKLMDFCTSTKNEEGLHFSFDKNNYYDIESPKAQAYFTTKSGERQHNLPLSLTITNTENNKKYDYSFILSSDRLAYKTNTLPKGKYSYKATASFDNKTYNKSGFITIEENNLESINLNINEVGLRQLAINNGGQFAFYDSLSTLAIENGKTRLSESISYKDVIDYKWIFGLLLLLLSAEWIVRKVKGSY